ncbi:MAG: phage holin family protein [Clostridia bacterium]|nr:phage holin family protein [Clostridia bacterium]
MKNETIKTTAACVFAILGSVTKRLALPFCALCVLMAADYFTGLIKSKQNGTVCSRTGLKGILKKLGYVAAVIAAAGVDYTVYFVSDSLGEGFGFKPVFMLLLIFWLIINESISILENLSAMGVPMPDFLLKAAKSLKVNVVKKGESKDE